MGDQTKEKQVEKNKAYERLANEIYSTYSKRNIKIISKTKKTNTVEKKDVVVTQKDYFNYIKAFDIKNRDQFFDSLENEINKLKDTGVKGIDNLRSIQDIGFMPLFVEEKNAASAKSKVPAKTSMSNTVFRKTAAIATDQDLIETRLKNTLGQSGLMTGQCPHIQVLKKPSRNGLSPKSSFVLRINKYRKDSQKGPGDSEFRYNMPVVNADIGDRYFAFMLTPAQLSKERINETCGLIADIIEKSSKMSTNSSSIRFEGMRDRIQFDMLDQANGLGMLPNTMVSFYNGLKKRMTHEYVSINNLRKELRRPPKNEYAQK
jgi:hypothetical protein